MIQYDHIRCPNDAGRIPQVGQHCERPGLLVRFFWCRYCEELFAVVGEDGSGVRVAASFSKDRQTGEWAIWKTLGNERDVEAATVALPHLGPLE